MKQCRKVKYSKKEAKRQLIIRGSSGHVYWCKEHQGYHLTKHPIGYINEWVWKRARSFK